MTENHLENSIIVLIFVFRFAFICILWDTEKQMSMQVQIKREKAKDREEVDLLYKIAFEQESFSELIFEFRNSNQFIPELARVARISDQIIGIIMYSHGEIVKGRKNIPTIIIASIAVLPAYQNLGIGAELVKNSFQKARELGYKSVLVAGEDDYFSRFGFKKASEYDISNNMDIPVENFMALELIPESLINGSGHLKSHPLIPELLKFSID